MFHAGHCNCHSHSTVSVAVMRIVTCMCMQLSSKVLKSLAVPGELQPKLLQCVQYALAAQAMKQKLYVCGFMTLHQEVTQTPFFYTAWAMPGKMSIHNLPLHILCYLFCKRACEFCLQYTRVSSLAQRCPYSHTGTWECTNRKDGFKNLVVSSCPNTYRVYSVSVY